MTPLVALLVAGSGLVVLSLATARRPSQPVPDLAGYLQRWSPLHGDYDPRGNAALLGWLRLSYAVSRPLAGRGIAPDVLTLWTVWLAFAVFVPARAGGAWPQLAGWILVASGLGDTIDGCVAVLTDRATRFGFVLDSMVDRVNDLVYLAALVAVGAPPALGLAAAVALFLLEYLRARAGNAGMGEIGAVTLGERGTRVAFCSAGIHFGGVFVGQAALVATVASAAVAAFAAVGLLQLVVAVRRALAEPIPAAGSGSPHEVGDDRR